MMKNLYNLFPPLVHFPGDLLPRVQPARLHQKSAALVAEIESNIFGNVFEGLEKIGKLFIAWKELKAILLSFCSSLARWCPNNLIFKEERKLRMRSLLMQKCREMDWGAINTQHVRHRRSCGWSGQQCSKSKRINNQKEIFIFSFVFVNILVVDGKTCVDFHKTAMTL